MKFRFVDKITAWDRWHAISGIKTVSFEEYCLKDAFADEPRLPEMLMLESFLQLGNWLVVVSSDFQQMGLAARISRVDFAGPVLPGQKLRLNARLIRRREDGFEFAGEGFVGERVVISGLGCVAIAAPLAEFQNPEDTRVLYSEIYEPGEIISS